jgi:two-component system OmpR family response regulator
VLSDCALAATVVLSLTQEMTDPSTVHGAPTAPTLANLLERPAFVEEDDRVKVLVVEDEARLASTLAMGLRAEGFVVETVANGVDGLWQATENVFDVVVLDIMLPGMSGYEVLREMRARAIWTPVLMLTAKDGEYDQADAFDLGADDYLTKPFSFIVLVARLRALLRRGAPNRPVVMTAGTLSLDPTRRVVARESTVITLTPREYGVLEYLMRNKDRVVTKTEILQNVWDVHYEGGENVVEVYVGYVRRKIDIPFGTTTIETIRGVGYRLESGEYANGN